MSTRMRIPTEIYPDDTLEHNLYETPVLTLKDEGLVYVSPTFALAYFTLRQFIEQKLEGEEAEHFLTEVEDEATYYTQSSKNQLYSLEGIAVFGLERSERDILIQPTHLFHTLLDYFPKEYTERELFLTSRRREYGGTDIHLSHMHYARLFNLDVHGTGMLRPHTDFSQYTFGGTYIRKKSNFRQSRGMSDTSSISHSTTSDYRRVSNMNYRYDFFTLLTVITVVFADYEKNRDAFSLNLALERARYFQKDFVEKSNSVKPKDEIKEYVLSRLTNKERRELLKQKKETPNTTEWIEKHHSQMLVRVTSRSHSRYARSNVSPTTKEYVSHLTGLTSERRSSERLRINLNSSRFSF